MPLNIPGLDEGTLKTLAKRYRKVLAAKKDGTPIPSLMQIQKDIVRAMGHKDLHSAQAAWGNQQELRHNKSEEIGYFRKEIRDSFSVYEKPWKEAVSALEKGPDEFSAWIKENAAWIVEMRAPRTCKYFDLLAYAASQGFEQSASLLEALGDSLTDERIVEVMKWNKGEDFYGYRNKSLSKPNPDGVARMLHRLDADKAMNAFKRFSDRKSDCPEISHAMMTDLFLRADKTPQKNHGGYFMLELEKAVIKGIESGNPDLMSEWVKLLSESRMMQVFSVMGNHLDRHRFLGHLLHSGQMDAFLRAEKLIDPVSCFNDATKFSDVLDHAPERVSLDYFNERVILAALSGNKPLIDYVLSSNLHDQKGLDKATELAFSQKSDEVFYGLVEAGGVLSDKRPQLMKGLPELVKDVTPSTVIKRLEFVFSKLGMDASSIWGNWGTIAHILVNNGTLSSNPDKCKVILQELIEHHGLDINQTDPEADKMGRSYGTPLENTLRSNTTSIQDVIHLMELGASPNMCGKTAGTLIEMMTGNEKGSGALASKVSTIPGVWDDGVFMSSARSLQEVKDLFKLGSRVSGENVAVWLNVMGGAPNSASATDRKVRESELLAMTQWAISQGIKMDEPLKSGNTLLHEAASRHGTFKCLALMVEQGADLNVKNRDGKTVRETADTYIASNIDTLAAARELPVSNGSPKRAGK